MSIYWLPVCYFWWCSLSYFSWIAYQRMAVFHHPPIPYHQSLSFYLIIIFFTYIVLLKPPRTSFPAEVLQLILGRKNMTQRAGQILLFWQKCLDMNRTCFCKKENWLGHWLKDNDIKSMIDLPRTFLASIFPLFAFLQKLMNQYSCNFLRWMKINFDVLTDLFLFLLRALFT